MKTRLAVPNTVAFCPPWQMKVPARVMAQGPFDVCSETPPSLKLVDVKPAQVAPTSHLPVEMRQPVCLPEAERMTLMVFLSDGGEGCGPRGGPRGGDGVADLGYHRIPADGQVLSSRTGKTGIRSDREVLPSRQDAKVAYDFGPSGGAGM